MGAMRIRDYLENILEVLKRIFNYPTFGINKIKAAEYSICRRLPKNLCEIIPF